MFTFYLRVDVIGAVAGPDTPELSEKSEPSVKIAYLGGNRAPTGRPTGRHSEEPTDPGACTPHRSSSPPPVLAFGEPDDRLLRGIQYAAASELYRWRLWNTGSSAIADDDDLGCCAAVYSINVAKHTCAFSRCAALEVCQKFPKRSVFKFRMENGACRRSPEAAVSNPACGRDPARPSGPFTTPCFTSAVLIRKRQPTEAALLQRRNASGFGITGVQTPGAVGAAMDFQTAFAAREGLQLIFDAVKRMRRAPGKAHDLAAGFAPWRRIDAKMSRPDLGCFVHVTLTAGNR
jgi:hypothetical protein